MNICKLIELLLHYDVTGIEQLHIKCLNGLINRSSAVNKGKTVQAGRIISNKILVQINLILKIK